MLRPGGGIVHQLFLLKALYVHTSFCNKFKVTQMMTSTYSNISSVWSTSMFEIITAATRCRYNRYEHEQGHRVTEACQLGCALTHYGHIKTAQQRTIIQQYGDWHTCRWWVRCYIWYSEEGTGRSPSPPRPLLAVPNVTANPSTASVPTSYHSMWQYNCLCTPNG